MFTITLHPLGTELKKRKEEKHMDVFSVFNDFISYLVSVRLVSIPLSSSRCGCGVDVNFYYIHTLKIGQHRHLRIRKTTAFIIIDREQVKVQW